MVIKLRNKDKIFDPENDNDRLSSYIILHNIQSICVGKKRITFINNDNFLNTIKYKTKSYLKNALIKLELAFKNDSKFVNISKKIITNNYNEMEG
jgi:hypothetical protein